MIQSDPIDDQEHDEQAERQRQHVIGVVRSGGDVQEKTPGEHPSARWQARPDPTATPGGHSNEVLATQNEVAVRITARTQSNRVDAKVGQRSLLGLGRDRNLAGGAIVGGIGHGRIPIR